MVVVGSVRKNRSADKILPLVQTALAKHTDIQVNIADLQDIPLPFYDHALSPSNPDFVHEHPETAAWAERVGKADGYVFLTPEYNHSTSAVLKNAIDWVSGEWAHKPVAFVSWGVDSGVRAVEHLRQITLQLRLTPLRRATYIPVFTAFDEHGNADERVPRHLEQTIQELYTALNS